MHLKYYIKGTLAEKMEVKYLAKKKKYEKLCK